MKKTKKSTLNTEEKQILVGVEAGKFKSVPKLKQEISRYSKIAKLPLVSRLCEYSKQPSVHRLPRR